MSDLSTLAKRLAKSLEWSGLSCTQMGVVLKTGAKPIVEWLNGVTVPSDEQLARWAEVCRVDIQWLNTGVGLKLQPEFVRQLHEQVKDDDDRLDIIEICEAGMMRKLKEPQ